MNITHENTIKHEDTVLIAVMTKYHERSKKGLRKYGTNLDRTDVDLLGWFFLVYGKVDWIQKKESSWIDDDAYPWHTVDYLAFNPTSPAHGRWILIVTVKEHRRSQENVQNLRVADANSSPL